MEILGGFFLAIVVTMVMLPMVGAALLIFEAMFNWRKARWLLRRLRYSKLLVFSLVCSVLMAAVILGISFAGNGDLPANGSPTSTGDDRQLAVGFAIGVLAVIIVRKVIRSWRKVPSGPVRG